MRASSAGCRDMKSTGMVRDEGASYCLGGRQRCRRELVPARVPRRPGLASEGPASGTLAPVFAWAGRPAWAMG
jgi:hypothetical protein